MMTKEQSGSVPDHIREEWFLEFERIHGHDYDLFLAQKLKEWNNDKG